jgi:hypothetical protein
MKIEEIREPVDVIALFRGRALLPLRFRWKQRTYSIRQVNGGWRTDEGASRFHHFAVMSEGPDVYELSYNERSQEWRIETVSLIG